VVVGHGRLAEIQFRRILERKFRSGGDAEAKGALFSIKRSPGNSGKYPPPLFLRR
jgi:hypothetical protein